MKKFLALFVAVVYICWVPFLAVLLLFFLCNSSLLVPLSYSTHEHQSVYYGYFVSYNNYESLFLRIDFVLPSRVQSLGIATDI